MNHRPVLTPEEIPWMKRARRSSRFLVGVSGGADSVALVCLLHDSGFRNLVLCHLNHGLRGRRAAADAEFVRRLAHRMGLPSEVGRMDVKKRMKTLSESMETAARNARHEFFADCARKHRCRQVILAHHAEDQAETVLWNLFRGSHGLKGMREVQEIRCAGLSLRMLRPLLGIRRDELLGWLRARGQRWREDESNSQPIAIRNRIRNELLPLLKDITGRDPVPPLLRGIGDAFEREEADARELEDSRVLDPQGRLHLPTLKSVPLRLQRLAFRNYLTHQGVPSVSRDLLDRCLKMMDPANPASFHLPGGRRIRRREGRIWIEK